MRHIIRSQQFTPELIQELFARAAVIKQNPTAHRQTFEGDLLLNLFYEKSTRTRISFDVAGKRLGMDVVTTENAKEFSSAAKGETLEDTIRVVAGYGFNAVVLRHDQEGAAELAAGLNEVPIINAGDGAGQHPTQALLDLFTIKDKFGRLDSLRVVIGGDLARGRTVHSLVYLLSKYPRNFFTFVAPPELRIKEEIKDYLKRHGVPFDETTSLEALEDANVVYWTRFQDERPIPGGHVIPLDQLEEIKARFTITEARVERMLKTAILMHPLPRVGEIAPGVDGDIRAKYFEQAHNGVPIRMALLEYVLTPSWL